jgi:DNA modification methylase
MIIELIKSQNIALTKLETNKGQIEGLPKNPRLIKDAKFEKLKKSIEDNPEMLVMREVLVYPQGSKFVIIGGNMRFQACKDLGFTEVPCKVLDKDTTAEQLRAITIKDNVGFGEHDWELLANEWDSVELEEWGLEVTNFEAEEQILEAEEDDYEVPDGGIETDIVIGDLFEIGEHRLLCGDSTDSDAVAKLMNGEKANLSFTSPPYNAGKSEALSGNTHTTDNKYNEYNDNQTKDVYLDLLIGFTNNALLFSEYLICNIQSLAGNKIALIEYLHEYKNNIIDIVIWDKVYGQPAMAENVMNSVWEYMFFISSKEKATRAIPNANFRGTVDNIYRGKPNRNNEFSKVHAAVFPIDLPQWGMQFTKEKDIILDQFTGSGTTMVAAHQLKRKCYGMELDCKYVEVIVQRMIKLDKTLTIKRNGIDETQKWLDKLV